MPAAGCACRASQGLRGARVQRGQEFRDEIDGHDLRIELGRQHQRRRASAAADIGDLQPAPSRQTRKLDGTPRLAWASRALPIGVDMQIDQQLQVVHRAG